MNATPYPLALLSLGLGLHDFAAGTYRVILTTAAYAPSEADQWRSDVIGELPTAAGYTAGGIVLDGLVWQIADGRPVLTAGQPTWPGASWSTARRAVVFRDTGSPGASPLLCWSDFGGPVAPGGMPFALNWPDGLFSATT